jgi:tRNA(Ile)-lysidine synthase
MHPLEKETLKTIKQELLIESGEKILIGVSGGPDSMALLHVLTSLSSELDITLAAVYVNHGLRPDESREEKVMVEAAAQSLDVECFCEDVDVKGLVASRKLSTEHAARLLRYDLFEQKAEQTDAAKIAVAHTADDQAEELLLRLIRGTARKGLSGMKTMRDARIIRPFLRIPKSLLLQYLEDKSIDFMLDSSNKKNFYLRNRIRNDLLPYLAKSYNPDIRQTLLRTANILQDEEEFLENLSEDKFSAIVTTAVGAPDKEIRLDLEHFNREPGAIQRRLLEKCCWTMNCEPRSQQIESLLQLATAGVRGGSLHLSDGLRVTKEENRLRFFYPQGRGPFRGDLSTEGKTTFPEMTIHTPGTYEFPELGKKLLVEHVDKPDEISEEVFPTGEYLDSSLFSFPLTIRGMEPGDRFHPLGAPGSKKVSDFLTDQKIERQSRWSVPVLCSSDSILGLPGLRIDHRYRITDKSTHVLRVSWENLE